MEVNSHGQTPLAGSSQSHHKGRGICISGRRDPPGLLYLPPFSSDLNAVEMTFAKLKGDVRNAAARPIDILVDAIASALAALAAQECLNFFAGAVYDRV